MSYYLLLSKPVLSFADKVVFVSYNILGVENASKHPDLYFKVPRRFLEWDRRKTLIHEEIHHYDASILCFQVIMELLFKITLHDM